MKIGVLTSSRADFGIYTPLLDALSKDSSFNIEIIAFGTHLSERHGLTINEITSRKFGRVKEVKTLVSDNDASGVVKSYASAFDALAKVWSNNKYDLVLCLGDRYEMSAAVQASIPFKVRLAHFHGGEKTLGAIDNIYRHQISLASEYHFTSTEAYKERVIELLDENKENVFNVGSLSLSGLKNESILDKKSLQLKFNLPSKPYILSTFHPETAKVEDNETYVLEMIKSFDDIPDSHHLIVTMPNADTEGVLYRKALEAYQNGNPTRITLVESFGKDYYFSALKHAEFVLGNSSSAIIEAASFGKYVINVGDRQKGRLQSDNTFNCEFKSSEITILIKKQIDSPKEYVGENIYVRNNTIDLVISELRKIANEEL